MEGLTLPSRQPDQLGPPGRGRASRAPGKAIGAYLRQPLTVAKEKVKRLQASRCVLTHEDDFRPVSN
jgi:hypothetical protein